MGEKVVVIRFDDFENELEADETITYALDGTTYQIDLSNKNAEQFRSELRKWIEVSRKTSDANVQRRPARSGNYKGPTTLPLTEIRAWAKTNGYDVLDRGNLPAAIVRAWKAAKEREALDTQNSIKTTGGE